MVNEFPFGTSQSGKRDYLFKISVCPGNFPSARTVRVVYHLPKISGLSRRARLDSSYNMKLVRDSRNL